MHFETLGRRLAKTLVLLTMATAGLAVPAVALAQEDAPIAAGLLQSVLGPAQAS